MQAIVYKVHKDLLKSKKTVSVAESCTGGLLSCLLTRLPGSSQYFILGVVTYSNKSKTNILKVPALLIKNKGAVSQEVCRYMARAVRKLAKANFGIGITGIAGPTGATPGKPVGTVFIAVDSSRRKICERFNFKGSRLSIRRRTSQKALEILKGLI